MSYLPKNNSLFINTDVSRYILYYIYIIRHKYYMTDICWLIILKNKTFVYVYVCVHLCEMNVSVYICKVPSGARR